MKTKKTFVLHVFFLLLGFQAFGQDSLLIKELPANKYVVNYSSEEGFSGKGWDLIKSAAKTNQYFLIGEVHGINEISLFIDALTNEENYQTFVAEIDPFLNDIIQAKINELSPDQLHEWYRKNAGSLSFYSFKKDFELLKSLYAKGIDVIGIDQITALNDVPVYLFLAELTTSEKRKEEYLQIAKTAEEMFKKLISGQAKFPYLMSQQFQEDFEELKKEDISEKELAIIEKLYLSRQIYTTRAGHHLRIKLMKNQLMNHYKDHLLNKKAIFRLGANHSPKGESFLRVYDVGNLVHNIAESQFNSSYHLAIFAKSGKAGNPLIGGPNKTVERQKELSVFYNLAEPDSWTLFDLNPLRRKIEKGEIDVNDEFLLRLIKGYDGLVIIPESTPGEHIN